MPVLIDILDKVPDWTTPDTGPFTKKLIKDSLERLKKLNEGSVVAKNQCMICGIFPPLKIKSKEYDPLIDCLNVTGLCLECWTPTEPKHLVCEHRWSKVKASREMTMYTECEDCGQIQMLGMQLRDYMMTLGGNNDIS